VRYTAGALRGERRRAFSFVSIVIPAPNDNDAEPPMTVTVATPTAPVDADTVYARRARYHTSANPFRFNWPAVPVRQFLAERDRAFDRAAPTGPVALDSADVLGTRYPATTPTLLARYLRVRAGEQLRTAFVASGEVCYVITGKGESCNGGDCIAWGEGDVFCLPGGNESLHQAGDADCVLFLATNEPLLGFEGLRAPAPGAAMVEAVHWPHAQIEQHFAAIRDRPITAETTGHSVMFTSAPMAPGYATIPSINVAINTLAGGRDQRPHRHNGAAITLAIQGEGVHSMVGDQRVEWSAGAAQITPATLLHSHHNRGTRRMRSLVIQDEGLHYYMRTPGFSFD
jgi:gentisate 1,2-dioxygenase